MKNDVIKNTITHDVAIDIMKFWAVLLITWSHFEKPLGEYGVLATGGNLGNTVFFFISGYTLLLSKRNGNFFNWYKRRINRIYPTVFAWAIVSVLLFCRHNDILQILFYGGGPFVTAIMACYLLFYPVKRFVSIKNWWVVMGIYWIVQGCMWFTIDRESMLEHRAWLDSAYFLAMLVGALVGKYCKEGGAFLEATNKYMLFAGFIICSVAYYAMMYIESRWFAPLEIVNIITLIGFSFFLYGLCCRSFSKRLFQNDRIHWLMRFVGGLCLEVYIVQPSILTDKLNFLFPLNLLIIFVEIIIFAYGLRTLGRIWMQTFREEDYDWKEIIKPF